MKTLLFLMLSLATLSLEAAHFQASTSVTQIKKGTNEYLVEMMIEKRMDIHSEPELIASPKILCTEGEPAQLTVASDDQADLISINLLIPKNGSQREIQTSILIKEKDIVVLSLDNSFKINVL